ncbi:MAG: hypothetical protein ABIT04_00680 [Novosphingobium sp.]
MTGNSQVIALEGDDAPPFATTFVAPAPEKLAAPAALWPAVEPVPAEDISRRPSGLAGGLALVLAIAWTGFFVWTRRTEFVAAADPRWWTAAIADWAVPVLLIGVLWLLAQRGQRQTRRFDAAATRLPDETERLGAGLTAVNRELGRARETLAGLAESGEEFRARFAAQEAEALATMRARLAALGEEGAGVAARLRDGEASALARWREATARLESDSSGALVLLDNAHRDAAEAGRERIRALSDEVELIEGRFEQQAAAHVAHGEKIEAWLAQSERRVAEIAAHGAEAENRLAASVEALTSALAASQSELVGAESRVATLTEASTRLLELITASAAHGREELPAALAASEQGLATLAEHASQLVSAIGDASTQGERLADQLEGSGEALVSRFAEVTQLQSSADQRAAGHAARLDELRDALTDIEQRNARLVGEAHGALATAVGELGDAAAAVLAEVAAAGPATVSALSRQLAEESSAGLQRVLRESTAETAGHLEQAVSHAAGISREATSELRNEIARVDELAGNLEARVALARREAEEQTGHEFAQRAAVISESLKSNAIDIAGALTADVADTAWAAYLRGDRGVFARRAVSLLGPRENRSIVGLYEADPAFRGHVSRYVHDFEAMLRQLLSARDGHVLAVTLLSSDMGKLYVALAQAIERLRR